MTLIDKLVKWLQNQVTDAGAKGCVFGLSGGVDSSVVGALCKKAFPGNVLAVVMPCFSNEQDLLQARAVAERFLIPTRLIDLRFVYNQLLVQLEGKPDEEDQTNLAVANLKPRLRMVTLYYHANKANYLVVGTGNKSEAVMGYCTKYGDAGVDIQPLGNLLKTQVRELAVELGVPDAIITKAPSAGLWPGQTDEAELGLTYAELDKIIIGLENNDLSGLNLNLVEKVRQKQQTTQHKRTCPNVFAP